MTLPGLLLQDCWRFAFFASGAAARPASTTPSGPVLLPALVLLRSAHLVNVFWFVLAWGAAATVAAAVGPLQARVMPRLLRVWAWLSRHRDLGLRYLVRAPPAVPRTSCVLTASA